MNWLFCVVAIATLYLPGLDGSTQQTALMFEWPNVAWLQDDAYETCIRIANVTHDTKARQTFPQVRP